MQKRTTVRLDPELEKLVKIEAIKRETTFTQLLSDALKAFLGVK